MFKNRLKPNQALIKSLVVLIPQYFDSFLRNIIGVSEHSNNGLNISLVSGCDVIIWFEGSPEDSFLRRELDSF